MNAEFILNTKQSVASNSPAVSKQGDLGGKSNENNPLQVFSSELEKQVEQQSKRSETPVVDEPLESSDKTQILKAENEPVEDGKILPLEGDVDLEAVEQIITAVLEQYPELDQEGLKEQLTPILEKITDHLQAAEQDQTVVADLLKQIAQDFVAAINEVANENNVLAKFENTTTQTPQPLQNFIDQLTRKLTNAESGESALPIANKEQLDVTAVAGQPAIDEATVGRAEQLQAAMTTTLEGDEQSKEFDPAITKDTTVQLEKKPQDVVLPQELRVHVENLITQISQILTKEAGNAADTKNGLGKTINQLVREWLNTKRSISSNSAEKDISLAGPVVKEAVSTEQNKDLSKIRSDILQALPQRNDAVKLVKNKQGESERLIVKDEVQIIETKLLDKDSKLTELMKTDSRSESAAKTPLGRNIAGFTAPAMTNQLMQGNTENLAVKAERPVLDIQPALQSNAWNKVLGSRVIWMAREGIQQASIQLNPANLGPVEVRLSMQNEQANVMFIAQHNATRDALEQALPRLRESFVENGLELANADVSEQSPDDTGDKDEYVENKLAQGDGNVAQANDEESEQIVEERQDIELGLSVYA